MDRRRFLASTVGLGGGAVAGCLDGAIDGIGGRDGPETAGSTAIRDLELESLAVEASPGGPVRVVPPDRPVVLDFFATWCAPCKPLLDELALVAGDVGDDVAFRSITSETDRDAVASFWRQHGGPWPVLLDPDVTATRAIGIDGLPTTAVLDAEGAVQWRHSGLVRAPRIRDALESVTG